jgi:hypothetical protein
MKKYKTLYPLHILCFGSNTIVLDANTVADLSKEFWKCIVVLHKKVAIKIKTV